MNTLKASKRDMSVTARALRREGYVTGCVYGREIEPISIQMEEKDVENLLKTAGKGSQVTLDVDGQTYDTLIKELDYNSLKHQIEALDFQALVSGEKVQTVAEIVLVNPESLKAGVLQQMVREVAYKAVPSALVDKIQIDVSTLGIGDVVKVEDLDIAKNEDVDLITEGDTVILTITESRAKAADTEAAAAAAEGEAAAGEAAEEPAAEAKEEKSEE